GHADDVIADERSTFTGAFLRMLDAAFPFQDGPALEAVLRKLGEDRAEIDLAVAKRTEAPGAVDPRLEAAIDAGAAIGIELGILHVEHLDAVVIDVDVFQVVEGLQH